MASQEFVKLETTTGEKFFLRDSIKSFGFSDNISKLTSEKRSLSVRVVFQTSGTSFYKGTYFVNSKDAYDAFREQILSKKDEQTRRPKDTGRPLTLAAFTEEVRNTMKSLSLLDMPTIDELICANRAAIAVNWANGDPATETALQILADCNKDSRA